MPIQIYPMFETALRAQAGRTIAEHQAHISELWSRFSQVAAKNPYAWSQKSYTAEEIRTPTPNNRMIGFPYTKFMNSNNDVDMSAALLLCSVEKAELMGVPRDRWIFPHSGSDAHEHAFVSHRHHFYDTPAIELAGRRVLELAGLTIGDIGLGSRKYKFSPTLFRQSFSNHRVTYFGAVHQYSSVLVKSAALYLDDCFVVIWVVALCQ